MVNPPLFETIKANVRDYWDKLCAETPEVKEEMTFEDFVMEVYLELV